MLSIPGGQVKIFLGVQPVDMRKGFDTLAALVVSVRLRAQRRASPAGVLLLWRPTLGSAEVVDPPAVLGMRGQPTVGQQLIELHWVG